MPFKGMGLLLASLNSLSSRICSAIEILHL